MSGLTYWIRIVGLGIFLVIVMFVLDSNTIREDWSPVVIGFAFYSTFIIYNWVSMYLDRNFLLQQIQMAVHNAESNKITEKIKAEYIYDNNSQSSINNVR
jgi:hypothetical protein